MEENPTQTKNWHDKNYKLLLLIPATLLIFSFIYMGVFYSNHNDFALKDISLTGGTSATIAGNIDAAQLKQDLQLQLEDLNTREIYDLITREQTAVIVETKSDQETTKQVLEDYLEYNLNRENSSFEFTGSTLGQEFYQQLLIAIWVSFLLMGLVVFMLFGKKKSIKTYSILLSLLAVKLAYSNISIINTLSIFLIIVSIPIAFYFSSKDKKSMKIPVLLSIISLAIIFFPSFFINYFLLIMILLSIVLFTIYFLYSIPSFAVIIAAFADILMTLVLINILGIKLSSAGIVAFLMLIGYSVDTDILLTTRVLKRDEGQLNERIYNSFKTGMTMTLTSLLAILIALFVVKTFSVVLTQIFTILSIGLAFDIFNTWITNVSILKWYFKKKK